MKAAHRINVLADDPHSRSGRQARRSSV